MTTDLETSVRGYVGHVIGDDGPERITWVSRFEAGDRHAVFRVSYDTTDGSTEDLVVRVSISDEPAERDQAKLEAAVLERLAGLGAPRLYDFRNESVWFDAPAMCMQFVDGEQRDLLSCPLEDVERLGAVVASVHDLPVDGISEMSPRARTVLEYVDERVELNASYLPRLGDSLPAPVRDRVDGAFSAVARSVEWARRAESFRTDQPLVLLHGDVGAANILWADEPILIDWEYARLGDPADEVAYIFGQHGLPEAQRAAFWRGYGRATHHIQLDQLVERARWWEPVLLLGSALWWLERWVWRAAAANTGRPDASVPRPGQYYLVQATLRLDRFDEAMRSSKSAPG